MLRVNLKHSITILLSLIILFISYLLSLLTNYEPHGSLLTTSTTINNLTIEKPCDSSLRYLFKNRIPLSHYFFCTHFLWFSYFIVLETVLLGFLIPNLYTKPFSIKLMSARIFLEFLQNQYISLTKIRIFESIGINVHNSLLDDLSISFRKGQLEFLKTNLEYLKKFKSTIYSNLEKKKKDSFENWITYATLEWFLTTTLFGYKLMIYIFPLFIYNPLIFPTNPYRGCIVAYVKTLKIIQKLNSETDFKNYLKRIERTPEYIDGILNDLKTREKKGILPPADVVIETCKYLENILMCKENNFKNHFIYVLVNEHLVGLPESDLSLSKRKAILEDTIKVIQNYFTPAIRKLTQYHYSVISLAPKEIGVWRIPNGEEIYRFHIYYFTSTTIHPMELQELGIKEVERITKKIIDFVQPEFKFDPKKETFGSFLYKVIRDPMLHFSFTRRGRRDAVHHLKRSLDEAQEKSKDLFGEVPNVPINVEYNSIFKDVSFSYQPGPWDGSENPRISINFDKELAYSKLLNKTCAFREGVPGHHMQLAITNQQDSLDLFRKNFICHSFFNGWGFYAETLAVENGWITDKWEKLGHYLLDLRMSAKLVIDCSMHYQGLKWDTETAKKFLVEKIGFDEESAIGEIRYIASLPGIGISQKIGQMKLVELRNYAKQQLGDKFDIKEFHSVILKNGSLPLDILAQVVQYWISYHH
ncbi:hypothetical protein CYY_008956 [Polysphondylium violaceum]|uniref:DUF885 family protein n=1 Tax=Polysphondylium violaceum TaxID=133409 RepID=A0A8J4PNK7_9MYCE|nr:hypothetical protein CYY_008956 [Polysphondylium violaceum]